jgi:ABC-2 type transport system permease protein
MRARETGSGEPAPPPRTADGKSYRPPARSRGPALALLGMLAICQRAYLTLWRQPVLLISTMLFPIVYLLLLGNALNRPLRGVPLAVVDEARNSLSAECLRRVVALESGRDLVRLDLLGDRTQALADLRRGRYRAVWVLPLGLARQGPAPSFIGDNTDRASYETLEAALSDVWQDAAAVSVRGASASSAIPAPAARLEAYPYLDYLTYLAPAVVCLAIFMGSMVSGGLQVLEDRMFGYHEGYLVTPVSTGAIVAGHILAGAIIASIAGAAVLVGVVLFATVPLAGPRAVAASLFTIFLTALAIASVWSLLFARAQHASVLRGMFGIINAALFFPSGALYPVESYPGWLRSLSAIDPLTYGLSGLRDLLLRGAPVSSCYPAWLFLTTFTLVCGVLARVFFRREI